METDWVVGSKREHRYDEIRELIGQLTLIEKYIRIRLINGTLHKDEDALRILLDLHKDAVYEIGMNLNSLKIIDSEEEEDCVEDEDDCDMRAEEGEDDDDCEAIDQYKDADDADDEDDEAVEKDDTCDSAVATDCVCKQIRDIDILRELYSVWLHNRDIYSDKCVLFVQCGQFYIAFGRDIDILQSTNAFMPYFTFANHQDEYVHYACFDQENFLRLTRHINSAIEIGYGIEHYVNDTIATRLNYD